MRRRRKVEEEEHTSFLGKALFMANLEGSWSLDFRCTSTLAPWGE